MFAIWLQLYALWFQNAWNRTWFCCHLLSWPIKLLTTKSVIVSKGRNIKPYSFEYPNDSENFETDHFTSRDATLNSEPDLPWWRPVCTVTCGGPSAVKMEVIVSRALARGWASQFFPSQLLTTVVISPYPYCCPAESNVIFHTSLLGWHLQNLFFYLSGGGPSAVAHPKSSPQQIVWNGSSIRISVEVFSADQPKWANHRF